jgi:hypothetical protein
VDHACTVSGGRIGQRRCDSFPQATGGWTKLHKKQATARGCGSPDQADEEFKQDPRPNCAGPNGFTQQNPSVGLVVDVMQIKTLADSKAHG